MKRLIINKIKDKIAKLNHKINAPVKCRKQFLEVERLRTKNIINDYQSDILYQLIEKDSRQSVYLRWNKTKVSYANNIKILRSRLKRNRVLKGVL